MTHLKTWWLHPLAAVLLLLSIVPTGSEVVKSMSDCPGFLLERSQPNIPGILEGGEILGQSRYKPICQTYKSMRRFVTLYDTENKIPVFSAYRYRGEEKNKRRPRLPTMLEPQLEGSSKNMWDNIYRNQATNDDYAMIGKKYNGGLERNYNRGHLFPSSNVFDKSEKISTFTLSNIVPQEEQADTKNKIPVFSAYKYRGHISKRPKVHWKIEPQLEQRMTNMWDDIYRNQATDNDYKNNKGYDRGHLFPSGHAFDEDDQISTFTLTNIVPQARTFNQGSWNKIETCVKCVMDKYCYKKKGVTQAFVVIGAQPGENKLNKWVNIPSMLWSAFCCYSAEKKKWLASAHWGDNVPDGPNGRDLQMKTLDELYNKLSSVDFDLFPGTECPLHENVQQFYPELNKGCLCPAPA